MEDAQTGISIEPDVTASGLGSGKGVGAGYPLSLLATREELAAAPPFGLPSGSSSSFGGNPLAATAGLASLEVILKEELVAHSKAMGERISDDILAEFAIVAEPNEVGNAIKARYGDVIDRILCTFDAGDPDVHRRQLEVLRAAG